LYVRRLPVRNTSLFSGKSAGSHGSKGVADTIEPG
jgi:hypothetical protein